MAEVICEIGLFDALKRVQNARQEWRKQRGPFHVSTVDGLLCEFMAEIFPDEGLDIVLGQWPKDATRLSTTYLCLFTSQTASTVITSGQTLTNVTETTYTSYARQSLAAATWGAQAAGTGGRKTTYSQITFPTVGATGATINGFFIGDASPPVKVVAQANFDDVTAVVLATNDVIKVTPTVQFNN
jgi:hypothetical protein